MCSIFSRCGHPGVLSGAQRLLLSCVCVCVCLSEQEGKINAEPTQLLLVRHVEVADEAVHIQSKVNDGLAVVLAWQVHVADGNVHVA